MSDSTVTVREAHTDDLPRLGVMGAALAQLHHDFDAQRFMMPDGMESGYRWWFGEELRNPQAIVLIAEQAGAVVGYAYGRLEERDWNALLDAHGGFHDLWVEPETRTRGAGRALATAMIDALTQRGVARIVLMTSTKNLAAQRLFGALGWRPTMLEMTREA